MANQIEAGGEQDKNSIVSTTQEALSLYEAVFKEATRRKLRVWDHNSYVKLTILAALNEGKVQDTVDRYEIAISEGQRRGFSGTNIHNSDAYIGIALSGLILSRRNQT